MSLAIISGDSRTCHDPRYRRLDIAAAGSEHRSGAKGAGDQGRSCDRRWHRALIAGQYSAGCVAGEWFKSSSASTSGGAGALPPILPAPIPDQLVRAASRSPRSQRPLVRAIAGTKATSCPSSERDSWVKGTASEASSPELAAHRISPARSRPKSLVVWITASANSSPCAHSMPDGYELPLPMGRTMCRTIFGLVLA